MNLLPYLVGWSKTEQYIIYIHIEKKVRVMFMHTR